MSNMKDLKQNSSKEYILTALAVPFGEESINGNIYFKESYIHEGAEYDAFKKFRKKLRINGGNGVPGTFGQKDQCTGIPLEDVAIETIDAEMRVDGIYVKIKVLDTPAGEVVKKWIDAEVPIYPVQRALGNTTQIGSAQMCEIAELISFDVATQPVFPKRGEELKIVEGSSITKQESEQEQGDPTYFTPEQREEINKMIDRKLENFANEVQKWVTEEFSPTLQEWLVEEFTNCLKITADKDKLKDE